MFPFVRADWLVAACHSNHGDSLTEIETGHKRFKRTLIYLDTNTQSANFRGNPLYQATNTTLKKKQLNGEKTMKDEMRSETTYLFWLSFVVFLSSA